MASFQAKTFKVFTIFGFLTILMMNFSYGTKLEVFTDKVSSSVKIFNSEQVDYILCGVNKQDWYYGKSQMAIRSVEECLESLWKTMFNKNDVAPLAYYFRPENISVLHTVLEEIRKPLIHLALYCNSSTKAAFMEKPQPVFIIEWPFSINSSSFKNSGQKSNFLINEQQVSCFPMTSLVFLHDSLTGEFWELYCIKSKIFIQQNVILESSKSTLHLSDLRNIMLRRQNFRKLKVRVLAKNEEEDQMEVSLIKENGTTRFGKGLAVSLLEDLQFGLNFTIQAIDGDECMTQSSDGLLTGMGRQIVDGIADISITMSTIEPYRLQWLAFLQPVPRSNIKIFFRQPPTQIFRNIFTQPVCPEVWLSLLGVWLLIITTAIIIITFSPIEIQLCRRELIIWAIGMLCQQSNWTKIPSSTSMKIIYSTTFLTSLVLFSTYSASIVSFGLYSDFKAVQSFCDLLNHDYILTGRFIDRQLNLSTDLKIPSNAEDPHLVREYFERNYKHLTDKSLSLNFKGVQLAFTPTDDAKLQRFAHIEMVNRFYYESKFLGYTDNEFCELEQHSVPNQDFQVGSFVRKRSPLQEFLNYRMIYAFERGTHFRMGKQFYKKFIPDCANRYKIREETQSIKIGDTFMVYKILFVGFVMSLTILVIEKLFAIKKRNVKRL